MSPLEQSWTLYQYVCGEIEVFYMDSTVGVDIQFQSLALPLTVFFLASWKIADVTKQAYFGSLTALFTKHFNQV